jgi:subtilase family serine protease
MAPGANIVYVAAANSGQDLDAALNQVVDHQLATIVTNSYGWSTEALPPGFIKPYLDIQIQAAIEGIGVYFSSGDDGDESFGQGAQYATADWPASSPFVTAVGGTSLAIDASNNYMWETGWESGTASLVAGAWSPDTTGNYLYGGGGGTSRLFAEPWYQSTYGVSSTLTGKYGSAGRVLPDISALGDPNTGFLLGQTQTFPDGHAAFSYFRIGGTSLSSPLTAGMMAVVEQQLGRPIGFANPTIYKAAKANPSAFHDVTASSGLAVVRANYRNSVDDTAGYSYILRSLGFDNLLTIHAAPGYDDVTGVGTPKGTAFTAAMIAAATTP